MTQNLTKTLYIITLVVLVTACTKYGVDGVTPIPKAVDLGIVVNGKNIKWASFNLGTSNECEYGDYYAWGETSPKLEYTWATYAYAHANGSEIKITKYYTGTFLDYWDGIGSPDNKAEFKDYDYVDDAARAKLGGKWRIPTRKEWEMLIGQCNWKWTTLNGVSGMLVTASNGSSIFLPASPRDGFGLYWSSSLDKDSPFCAKDVIIKNDYRYVGYDVNVGSHGRAFGMIIRPVCEE